MVFSSTIFLIYFLPLVLVVYQFLNRELKNIWLLVTSLFFYAWGEPTFLFLLLGACIFNFFSVQQMNRYEDETRKKYLAVIIVFNLLFLGYFKYVNFFIDNTNSLFSLFGKTSIQWKSVLLPIGISFYTFQSLTYSIDVYRRRAEAQKHLHNYMLYSFFFPHLIAGPIVKYNSIVRQIAHRDENSQRFVIGFKRFAFGLGKKVLIANTLGEYYHLLLSQGDGVELGTTQIWIAMLAYTFQIYFDFSGYSDMAIGLAKLFGFDFPENFDRPYTSSSITQFWRKWHITLGDFMKNYLYIPLGGNQNGVAKTYRNLFVVFLLSGLWHGDNWTFLLWGAYHGLWLVLDRIILVTWTERFRWFSIPLTFLIVLNGWVLFQADTLDTALTFYKKMWNWNALSLTPMYQRNYYTFHLIIAALICLFGLSSWCRQLSDKILGDSNNLLLQFSSLTLAIMIFYLGLSDVIASDFNPFIYFKF